MRASHTIRPVFDDPNLVSAGGLVPALRLAEAAGLHELLEGVTVPSPNAGVKTASVVAGMLAGADSIVLLAEAARLGAKEVVLSDPEFRAALLTL